VVVRWIGLVAAAAAVLAASPPPSIPLCAGLTIVTAIAQPEGDYESIKVIESIDAAGVRLKYSSERVARDQPGHPIRKTTFLRTVRTADLERAGLYLQVFSPAAPVEAPGTTAIGTSARVLSTLKSAGTATLGMFDLPAFAAADHPFSADRAAHPNIFDYELPLALRRVESSAVPVDVTVNGVRRPLPAIHASGVGELGEKADFLFLDDEKNPLALRWRIKTSTATGSGDALDVVKIAYRCSAPADESSSLERALSESRRAAVYDIYFSFNSDVIRDESEPTLKEIGDLLRRHLDWTLNIEGHTDGIASDAFNLDLSRRRADAVKAALVGRFGVAPERLATSGYGRSRPRDTNDTPEGRARNRRVELVRQP
jgi:outer membrane protein OmpA-like peptidoglycan-associated protein